MKPAVSVQNVSKAYPLGAGPGQQYQTLRESIAGAVRAPLTALRGRPRGELFYALNGVSFEIEPGDTVGLIGRNGAGKSTLLKILGRITHPTSGRVEFRGRVASLLEVGTGFHPELTGRENIYLNGAILGMTRREIDAKFDAIVEFSGVERFLDTPVKRYSSGMYVRLAFAVASHLEPEILLVDEVLSVGDAVFQQRCLRKMHEISTSGRTVFFVSHNLASVRSLCRKAIVLDQGRVASQGEAGEQVSFYLTGLAQAARLPLAERTDRVGSGRVRLDSIRFSQLDDQPVTSVPSGSPLKVRLGYRAKAVGEQADVSISFWSEDGLKILQLSNRARGSYLQPLSGSGEFECVLPRLPLAAGLYHVNVWVGLGHETTDHLQSAAVLDVLPGDFYETGGPTPAQGALVFADHEWGSSTPWQAYAS